MSLALLHPYAAMPFGAGSAEISTAPLAGGTVYQAVQSAEDASDGKDAAFENLITKMAKVVDDLLKEKAVSSQRIIQLESQRDEAEKASQAEKRAMQESLKTLGKEIIALKQSNFVFKQQVASLEMAFQKHVHQGTGDEKFGPILHVGTKTIHIQKNFPYRGPVTVPSVVPDYRSIPTYCQTQDS